MSRLMGFLHDEGEKKHGWQVDYLCADGLPLCIRRHGSQFVFPFQLVRKAYQAARAGLPYDIINVHEPSAAATIIAKAFLGKPRVVVTSHGLEERAWELEKTEAKLGRKRLPWRSRLLRPLTILWPSRFALKNADHVFCLNEEDRSYLQQWLNLPEHGITRLYPGANPIFADSAEARDYQGAQDLLFAGSWRYNKGIADLIKGFELLAERFARVALTIVGSGVPANEVRAQFAEAVRGRVRVIPVVSEGEASTQFAKADIFILPSLFEGTPLTLIEAMASGLPIVATETGGVKDVIRQRKNGILIPIRSPRALAAALAELLEAHELRETLGRNARSDATELYSWELAARPLIASYRALTDTQINVS